MINYKFDKLDNLYCFNLFYYKGYCFIYVINFIFNIK